MAFSVSGFRKNLGKTTQFLSEKIGNKEGSKVDAEFQELEKTTDKTAECMTSINNKVMDFLQPNPAVRAKLATQAMYARARGTAAEMQYPQTERQVGDILRTKANEIGGTSSYAGAVMELAEGFMRLADNKDSLDCDIKQNFIDPMEQTIKTDYKESILAHRKKMNSRRLDYDFKITAQEKGKCTDEELYAAEDKFNESMQQADTGMKKFVLAEEEHIHQLLALVGYIKNYHENALRVLDDIQSSIQSKAFEAQNKPRPEVHPIARISSVNRSSRGSFPDISGPSEGRPVKVPNSAPPTPPVKPAPVAAPPPAAATPSCRALFDFDAENPTELQLKEGEMIRLIKKVDGNWYEGEVNGRRGLFPTNYVEIVNPI